AQLAALAKPVSAVDVMRTVAELTIRSVSAAVGERECYVCGGGVFNAVLMRGWPKANSTEVLGVAAMQVEALAFAWLARQCFASAPGNVPEVTGAKGPRILGAVYPA
ncbi:MAG: anhydro-N-acetylmuramic acid kinase, partial [Casimicrobium sp.]